MTIATELPLPPPNHYLAFITRRRGVAARLYNRTQQMGKRYGKNTARPVGY